MKLGRGLAIGIGVVCVGVVSPVRAAVFVLTSGADAHDAVPGDGLCDDGGGRCTLRAAVEEANALAGPDSVSVPPGLYGRGLALGAGPIGITDALVIAGAGAATTVLDANFLGRMIDVATGIHATISGVTIRNAVGRAEGNGGDGGAIWNRGTLTLNDCVVTANVAPDGAGIMNEGTLAIARCTFSGNHTATSGGGGFIGGGIFNNGVALTVTDSTFSGNSSRIGGGISTASGAVTVVNSTFSGNTASDDGGGMFTVFGAIDLTNVTITGNTAGRFGGGGVAVNPGFPGPISVANTIISGNTDTAPANLHGPDCRATLTSHGYNLIEDTTHCVLTGDLTGNVTGVSANLGALQENGGPTKTHAPLPGSPTIDAGNPAAPGSGGSACPAADQRGVGRPLGVSCDIGAVEFSCGDGIQEPFEGCDDGNAVDGDGCDSNCTPTGCGNGIVTTGEDCDDGNQTSGDCCAADCHAEAAGSSCADGNACTTDACDGAGHCASTPGPGCPDPDGCHYAGACDPATAVCNYVARPDGFGCDDGDPCTSPDTCQAGVCEAGPGCSLCLACETGVGCRANITPGCRTTTSPGSSLVDVIVGNTAAGRFKWKWSGQATTAADFGSPTTTTDYAACVYDDSAGGAMLAVGIPLDAGPLWKGNSKGFTFKDQSALTRAKLRPGGDGKAKISVSSRIFSPTERPPFVQNPAVVVQLKNSAGACWDATYGTHVRNNAMEFRARSD